MNTMKESRSSSNTSFAIEALRELIFAGELPAGTDHLESELATRLGMSRTPVREALLVVESQGLIDVRPRKGVRIKSMSAQDVTEAYDILTALECLAAAQVARRSLSAEQLSPLTDLLAQMEAARASDALDAWVVAEVKFHQVLVGLSGNARAAQLSIVMADQLRRAHQVTLFMQSTPMRASDAYQAIIDALLASDPDAAEQAQRSLRNDAKRQLVEIMTRHRLSSI